MSALTAAAVVAHFDSLDVVPKAMLALIAVTDDDIKASDLFRILAKATPWRRGQPPPKKHTIASVRKLLDSSFAAGIISHGPAYSMPEHVREPIIRELLHDGHYATLVAMAAQLAPLKTYSRWAYGMGNSPGTFKRELRRAIYAGDLDAYNKVGPHLLRFSAAPMVLDPLESAAIEGCRGELLVRVLLDICNEQHQSSCPIPELPALLLKLAEREEAAKATTRTSLWVLVAEDAILRGDLTTARLALRHLTSSGRDEGITALLYLVQGETKAADKAYGAWLAGLRRYAGTTAVLPPRLAGFFLPLAYLLRGTQQRKTQALRLIQLNHDSLDLDPLQIRESWTALRPLLDPKLTGQVPPVDSPHPASVLLQALACTWADRPLPSPARLAAARSTAQQLGWHWLSAEFDALAAAQEEREPPARSDGAVALVSHRQRTPRWAQMLDAVESRLPATGKTKGKPPRRADRIAWYIHADPLYLTAKVQKPRAQGWSDGRAIANARIASGLARVSGASDADRRIASHIFSYATGGWRRSDISYDWRPEVWTELIDHPALFALGSGAPVAVVQRQPRLVKTAVPGGFKLSVVPANSDSIAVEEVCAGGFEVTVFDKAQRAVADALAMGVVVPKAGRARLDDLVLRVSSLIPLAEDDQDSTQQVDGQIALVARLARVGEGLSAQIVVRPAGPTGPALEPGRGGQLILARTDSGAVRVQRDLAAELAAATTLRDQLPALDLADWQDDRHLLPDLADALELLSQLDTLRESVTIEWFDGDPLRLHSPRPGAFKLTVDSAGEWFEARGELAVDEGKVLLLSQLLRLLPTRRGRFVTMADGDFIALSADFVRRLEALERAGRTDRSDRNSLRLHPLAAPLLQPLAEDAGHAQLAAEWHDQIARMSQPVVDAAVPVGLDADLRPYQLDGYRWLCRLASWGVGACLADDMGLGKTVQTLALLLSRGSQGPALVVAPTSVCAGWREQSWRFTPDLVVYDLRQGNRQQTLDSLVEGDVVVCSYGLLVSEQEALSAISWSTVVFDESQAIKNPQTLRHKAARSLSAGFRVALTGTPVENRLEDIAAQMAVLNPGLLGSAAHFRSRFARPVAQGDRDALRQLRSLVHPVVLRRTKAEVLQDLPEKTIIDVPVQLEGHEADVYESIRRQAQEATLGQDQDPNQDPDPNSAAPGGESRFAMLAWLTRLRLAACHPRLALKDDARPSTGPPKGSAQGSASQGSAGQGSAKLRALLEIVDSLQAGGHRALVFSQFTRHLDLVQEALDQQGITYQRLDGSTPPKQREQRVAAYQAGDGLIFLISLRAGGFGLNLTAADYVIHLDPWWNPAVEEQASDRAHRIGQTRPVTVYRIFAKDTVEETILELQHDKRQVADALMEGADAAAGLGLDDLRAMLLGSATAQ